MKDPAQGTHAPPLRDRDYLDAVIIDLYHCLRQLSAYIDAHVADLDTNDYARFLALQGQLSSRLGRLMRDKQQISGEEADELTQAINEALDELSEEWGVSL